MVFHGSALAAVAAAVHFAFPGRPAAPPVFSMAAPALALPHALSMAPPAAAPPALPEPLPHLSDEAPPPPRPDFAAAAPDWRRLLRPEPPPEPPPATVPSHSAPGAAPRPEAVTPAARERAPALSDAAYVQAEVLAGHPPPRYPRAARRRNLEGVVLVWTRLSAAGRILEARVQSSSGHAILDEAALEAVRSWSFQPATRGGRPVGGELVVPVRFRLQS